MTPLDPEEIRLYRGAEDLPPQLWDDLARRPPAQAAEAVGGRWEAGRFLVALLGCEYLVDPAARRVWPAHDPERPVGFQAAMVLVTALANSQGVPPSGRMVTPPELPGGRFFFTGPHAVPSDEIARRFGDDPPRLLEAARRLGGEPWEGVAPVAARIPGLPLLPLYVLLWGAEDDQPPRAVLGLDDRAHFHLALDGVWALLNVLVRRLGEG